MLWAADASAQLSSGIHFGVMGGFTSTNTKISEGFDYKNVSLFHVGLTAKFGLGAGFAIQPSLTYQMKGTELRTATESTEAAVEAFKKLDAKVGYLELPLQIQWGPDLMALRPYVFAEPFVGYAVNFNAEATDGNQDVVQSLKNQWNEFSVNRLEYGVGFGGGIEVNHFQISAQWFMNLGNLADENGKVDASVIGQTVQDNMKDWKKNFQGFKLSLAVLF